MPGSNTVKLTPQARQSLTAMNEKIAGAEKSIATLKKLGMDVQALEDHLTWAKETRETLLKEFG